MDHTPSQLSGRTATAGSHCPCTRKRTRNDDWPDEATGNLDSRTSYEIMALMQELNANQGKTIVFVTHEPDIASFSSRTIQLRDGRIQKDTKIEVKRSAKEVLENLPVTDDY